MSAASARLWIHDQLYRPVPHLSRHDRYLPGRHDCEFFRRGSQSAAIDVVPAQLYCLYLVAILFSFYLPDYLGRRSMLMGGALVCAACLTITSTLNVAISPSTDASRKAGLAMIFIWYFSFGVSRRRLSSRFGAQPTRARLADHCPPSIAARLVSSRVDHVHRSLLGSRARADAHPRHLLRLRRGVDRHPCLALPSERSIRQSRW